MISTGLPGGRTGSVRGGAGLIGAGLAPMRGSREVDGFLSVMTRFYQPARGCVAG